MRMEELVNSKALITKTKDLVNYKSLITKTKDFFGTSDYYMIHEGQQFNAFFTKWPEIGKNFIFYDEKFKLVPITTTTVLEIIDEKTFRTKNSIYTIYTIEQQRDDKIDNILK